MTSASGIRPRLGGVSGLAHSARTTRLFLGRQLWLWPILAAVGLGALGWWLQRTIAAGMREQLAAQLTTMRDADVTALRVWMKEQEANARSLARDEALRPAVRELLRLASSGEAPATRLLASRALADVRARLRPGLKIFGYTDFFVVSPRLWVVASDQDAAVGKALGAYRGAFFRKVLNGQVAVSKPYRSPLPLADTQGELKADLPTMLTAAPLRDENGMPLAALGLRIRPEAQFSQILRVARFGNSGETFAFDARGLLLSRSRFDNQLKRIGLLADLPDAQSILTVELRDPQVNLLAGARPTRARAEQPLTRMAAEATAGQTGFDVRGYRDYRGVPVVGAWTWLPEYDFGLATEMDVAEAFGPLYAVRPVFSTVMALLALGAAAIFAGMHLMARRERALEKAVEAARQLGQYTLEEKIGAGGMGSVYRARHALLRRPTAIKLLDHDKVSDLAIARFEREVQLTSQLSHPNTVAIYDYGRTADGVFYYAMEYLDGINLEDLVERFGAQPEGRVVAVLQQVCSSLAEAHARGLIHRDIKPANILLNCRGGLYDLVKVLDFGLARAVAPEGEAKLTATDVVAGTPLYMAPEAIERPSTIDARADVYAVGAVGYFLLTGTPVFQGETLMEICMQHVRAAPELPSQRLGRPITSSLEALLLQCLAKAPADRPPSAEALWEELASCEASGTWTRADAETWWRQVRADSAAPALALAPTTTETSRW